MPELLDELLVIKQYFLPVAVSAARKSLAPSIQVESYRSLMSSVCLSTVFPSMLSSAISLHTVYYTVSVHK